MRKKRQLHRILGFVLGLPLVWLAATGLVLKAAILWHDSHPPQPGDRIANASSSSDSSEGRWQRMLATLEAQGQLASLRGVSYDGSVSAYGRAFFQGGETWFLDPLNGEIVERRAAGDDAWVKLLTQLHRGKFFGSFGRYAFSGLGLASTLLILSGLLLLRKVGQKRGLAEQHLMIGKYISLPLIFVITTGSLWNVSEELRALPPVKNSDKSQIADWRRAFALSIASNAGETPREFYRIQGRFMASFSDAARIYVDDSGIVDLHRPFTWRGWFEPFLKFHSGDYPLGLVITMIAGFGAIAVFSTGVLIQLRRYRLRGKSI